MASTRNAWLWATVRCLRWTPTSTWSVVPTTCATRSRMWILYEAHRAFCIELSLGATTPGVCSCSLGYSRPPLFCVCVKVALPFNKCKKKRKIAVCRNNFWSPTPLGSEEQKSILRQHYITTFCFNEYNQKHLYNIFNVRKWMQKLYFFGWQ